MKVAIATRLPGGVGVYSRTLIRALLAALLGDEKLRGHLRGDG